MRQNPIDDEQLRSYLLGDLPEVEEDLLEQRLLAEEEPFDLLEALEAELLAAVSRGELPAAESEKILRRLASSPQGQARLALARSLNTLADDRAKRRSWSSVLPFSLRAVQPRGLWMALAALLLIGFGVSWFLLQRPDVGSAGRMANSIHREAPPRKNPPILKAPKKTEPIPQQDRLAKDKQDSQSGERRPEPVKFVIQLAFTTLRGAEEAAVEQHQIPQGTEIVEIQVDLEGLESAPSFHAAVQGAEGASIWEKNGLKPKRLDWGMVLVLDIPAGRLPDGRYTVAVKAQGDSEEMTQELNIVHEKR